MHLGRYMSVSNNLQTRFHKPHPRSSIFDFPSSIRHFRFWIRDSRFSIPDLRSSIFGSPSSILHFRFWILDPGFSIVKTTYIDTSVFARHWPQNIVNTVNCVTDGKNIVNTMVLGFWGAKNIGIYHVFCSKVFNRNAQTLPIWRLSATTKVIKKTPGVTTTTTTTTATTTTTTTTTTTRTKTRTSTKMQPTDIW